MDKGTQTFIGWDSHPFILVFKQTQIGLRERALFLFECAKLWNLKDDVDAGFPNGPIGMVSGFQLIKSEKSLKELPVD